MLPAIHDKSFNDMTETYTFARFWKCALQVNPAGYIAYRGQDHDMSEEDYNQQLLDACLQENIKAIGLANHGNVDGVDGIRSLFNQSDIVVFPGFEISSAEKAHFVCLFPEDVTTTELNRYLGRLDLTNPLDGVRLSGLGAEELLKRANELGGLCYAAHSTNNSGVLKKRLNHVWCSPELKATQIPGSVNELPDNYKNIVENKNPDYKRERPIAVINALDVAKPEDVSKPGASCLIKMTRPCFESFKMAFLDPDSRVRLHADVPNEYFSKIERIRFDGGYLDGIEISFSDHLNTVIGGRGTGKSTLIECIRYALEILPKGGSARKQHEEILKENLGKEKGRVEIVIRSSAFHGKRYVISRRYGEGAIVRDANKNVSSFQPLDLLPGIEIYGQNEIYEIAQDPGSQLQLLERFLPADSMEGLGKLGEIHKKLQDNKDKLLKVQSVREDIEVQVAQLPRLEEQAKQFKELGLEEKLKVVPLLEREKNLGLRVLEELNRVDSSLQELRENLPDLVFLSDTVLEGLPDEGILKESRGFLDTLKRDIEVLLKSSDKDLDKAKKGITESSSKLITAIKQKEQELEEAFKELPETEGKSGREIGSAYQHLLKEIEAIRPSKSRLKGQQNLQRELLQQRANFLAALSDTRANKTREVQTVLGKLNKRLAGKLKISVDPEGERLDLKAFLLQLEGVGEKRLAWVDEAADLSPISLVRAIQEGKDALPGAGWGITPSVADALMRFTPANLYDLQTLELSDKINIELNISHEGKENYRSLDRLSTGQQCTAILHLLLLDNRDPLILDQPEDNLDNAFIADRIVVELRDAKLKRQFLFATHNANIPVFGDAEWIGILSVMDSKASMSPEDQGSIDVSTIRVSAADILEGGRAAFVQRKEKYGF